MANGQVLSSDDGDELQIMVMSYFGGRQGIYVTINQLDDTVLQAMVTRCETLARQMIGADEELRHVPQAPDTFVPVKLWHDETVRAMQTTRGTVIPELLNAVERERLNAAGFLGFMARAEAWINKEGISAFSEETDSEVTVTARTPDGKSSGWDGRAARNWNTVSYADVATRAIDFAKRGAGAQALEPGRRTAILSPSAVAQVIRCLAEEFRADESDDGMTGFSRPPGRNKIGQQVFDARISMCSDPADPDGGYRPYFDTGFGTPAMSWVENGVLKNLAYTPNYAAVRGKSYASLPWSLRVSGGPASVEQMIAQCNDGIYVNRFSNVNLIDLKSGMTTGVTRDGCFFVKNGKIDRPIKNFRFIDSPFFFLNRIEALGHTVRAAFGYTLPNAQDRGLGGVTDWPRQPIIVPPMMVRDFNFSALVDAV